MKKTLLFILVSLLPSTAFAQVVDFTDITVETEQKVLIPKDPVGRVFANIHLGHGMGFAIGAHAGWFKTHGAYVGINKSLSGNDGFKSSFSMSAGYIFSPARSRKTGLLQSNWFQLYLGLGPTFFKCDDKTITEFSLELGTMYTLGCGLNLLGGLQYTPSVGSYIQLGIGWTFGKNRN